jgi:bidirectional [NiFe] hydrogenase diaphorase subunit
MGTPLRQIVEEMGGGAPGGAKIKAVQTGGPRAGAFPRTNWTRRWTMSRSPASAPSWAPGGMIVMDESTRMPEVARYFMEFCMDESCGKCIPCRAGTVQMHRLLDKIVKREADRRRPVEARGAL